MVNAKEGGTCVKKHLEVFEKQERENAAAVKAIEKGVAEVVSGIRAQERENVVAVKEIDKGVAEVVSGIRAQERKNDKFVDLFYYGCVKKE